MNYRSISDLSYTIRNNLYKLPENIDLIIGVPRSGMMVANILALFLNIKITDLSSYIADTPLRHGHTRIIRFPALLKPSDAKNVLIIDDSIDSGKSLDRTRSVIADLYNQKKIYCAVYSTEKASRKVDIFFEIVPQPRIFEWNVMHRPFLEKCCLDIDGVLCFDPTDVENDDGINYINFLRHARALIVPSYRIGHLVTSRLEKYRNETEQWLNTHNVIYNQLHMLDLPDAQTRRQLGCHAAFKAEIFRSLKEAELFIESEANQAIEIAKLSGKTVLCTATQKMYYPEISYALIEKKAYNFYKRIESKLYRLLAK